MKYLLVLNVLHSFMFVHCLQFDSPHVCFNDITSLYYCCSDYELEEINGTCIACKLGFTSDRGKRCMPCEDNYYGEKCLENCKCSSFQRCHHVLGCLLNTDVLYSSRTYDSELISTSTFSDDDVPENTKANDKPVSGDNWIKNLLIYSAATTGVIVIIGMVLVYKRCMRTKQQYNASQDLKSNNSENVMDYIKPESMYHTIDDIMLDNSINETNVAKTQCAVSSFISDSGEDQPYDEPDDVESSNVISGGLACSIVDFDRSSYLHPYQPLVKESADLQNGTEQNGEKSERGNGYSSLTKVVVHQLEPSSAVFDNGSEHSDGKLNQYQPLQNTSMADKKHVYTMVGTSKIDDSDEKLNQYQPLQNASSADKNHEYTKVGTSEIDNSDGTMNQYQPLQNISSADKNHDYTKVGTSKIDNSDGTLSQYQPLQNISSADKNHEYTKVGTSEIDNSDGTMNQYQPSQNISADKNHEYTKVGTSEIVDSDEKLNQNQHLQNTSSADKNHDYTKSVTSQIEKSESPYQCFQNKSIVNKNNEYTKIVTSENDNFDGKLNLSTFK